MVGAEEGCMVSSRCAIVDLSARSEACINA